MLKLVFGYKLFRQINDTVLNNISRALFVNGKYDNDLINYHVLGIGGTSISLSFMNCINSTSIELKFLQIIMDGNIQMRRVAPMRRNLLTILQRRGI